MRSLKNANGPGIKKQCRLTPPQQQHRLEIPSPAQPRQLHVTRFRTIPKLPLPPPPPRRWPLPFPTRTNNCNWWIWPWRRPSPLPPPISCNGSNRVVHWHIMNCNIIIITPPLLPPTTTITPTTIRMMFTYLVDRVHGSSWIRRRNRRRWRSMIPKQPTTTTFRTDP